jgi:hypothetical protein
MELIASAAAVEETNFEVLPLPFDGNERNERNERIPKKQLKPRAKKIKDYNSEFVNIVGNEESESILREFHELNAGNATQKALADALISELVIKYKLLMNVRLLWNIFHIGNYRIKRIKDLRQKSKPGGLNGSQVTPDMIKVLSDFMTTIATTERSSCSHQEAKRFCTVEGIKTWQALYAKYEEFCGNQDTRLMSERTFCKHMKEQYSNFTLGRSSDCKECDQVIV